MPLNEEQPVTPIDCALESADESPSGKGNDNAEGGNPEGTLSLSVKELHHPSSMAGKRSHFVVDSGISIQPARDSMLGERL